MPFPLAVVIPTYNRRSALQTCLEHLEKQSRKDFEVVIADDGSTDGTEAWVSEYVKRTPLSVRYLRQRNSGPARARNLAISVIEAPITLLIGDDIFASPEFTAIHMRLHEERPEDSVAGVGLTIWDEEGQEVTPFMRWLDMEGVQFAYGNLLCGTPPDWKHFYTSNLSVKTSLLRRFQSDESFPCIAMEDIELGCRIHAEHGLEMFFLPDAVARHLHPTTFVQSCRRMEKAGESTAYFDEMWPGMLPRPPRSWRLKLAEQIAGAPLVTPALEWLAEMSLKISCPNRLMMFVLLAAFDRGYQRHLVKRARAVAGTENATGSARP